MPDRSFWEPPRIRSCVSSRLALAAIRRLSYDKHATFRTGWQGRDSGCRGSCLAAAARSTGLGRYRSGRGPFLVSSAFVGSPATRILGRARQPQIPHPKDVDGSAALSTVPFGLASRQQSHPRDGHAGADETRSMNFAKPASCWATNFLVISSLSSSVFSSNLVGAWPTKISGVPNVKALRKIIAWRK
jgi:hypothetical protein